MLNSGWAATSWPSNTSARQAAAHAGLGHAHRALGDQTRARHHYQQALRLDTELKSPETDTIRAYVD
jgi:Tetratricopeptide repeat